MFSAFAAFFWFLLYFITSTSTRFQGYRTTVFKPKESTFTTIFTTNSPEVSVIHLIHLERIKGLVDLGTIQWFSTVHLGLGIHCPSHPAIVPVAACDLIHPVHLKH